MEIIEFIIVAVCGFGIGVLSGMFGIGGGGLIVPLLHMAFGLPILAATSTSLLTIAPTGLSGSYKHIRQKTISLRAGVIIGCFGAVASVASSLLADSLPDYLIVVITVTVILFSVGMMLRTLLKDKNLGRKPSAEEELAADADAAGADAGDTPTAGKQREITSLLLPMVIGFIAGGIAGLVGVGGGFIIVPFCVAYLGFSLKRSAGTSLLAISIIAIPGIITHGLLGHIWWLYGIAIMIGTVPGAQLGAWLVAKLPERPMRFAFMALLTVIGIMMFVQEFFI